MGYLEQFARNQRRKEQTEVLTARLPKSLYNDFKTRCDELGLSISEAVYLLVEREMKGLDSVSDEPATTIEYKMNDDVVATNTNVVKKNTRKSKPNTKRFTTIQWKVDGQLPCPVCGEWKAAENFSRHAKVHGMTTDQIFKSEEYEDRIKDMIEAKKR
jgi:antitoxin component of RelBE/YafQ-DinJ toxin-antitoxin module